MSVYLKVMGCRLNQAEADGLEHAGFVARPGSAALIILHGCAVTARSERRARQHIFHWQRLPGARRIAVTGCLARHWLTTGAAPAAVELVAAGWPALPAAPAPSAAPPRARTRRTLKLQDGCTHHCTYCIVPTLRPGQWHAEPQAALAQLDRWLAQGVKEIVVSGLHLAAYRHGDWDLVRWLAEAVQRPGAYRLRLSSLEPQALNAELLALIAAQPQRLCPHLHLPVQSGSDAVLRRMHRPYDRGGLHAVIAAIRRHLPDAALTVDCLVGFPGETEDDFAATAELLRAMACARAHIFPFSPRPGTPAATYPAQVPIPLARERVARLHAIAAAAAQAYRTRFLGQTLTVLTENPQSGYSENYQSVALDRPCPWNCFVPATVTATTAAGLTATVSTAR